MNNTDSVKPVDMKANMELQHVLSLNAVAEINEKMKLIVQGSNRLYIISLNAMFASRSATTVVRGFVEVTALLREFSQRLDHQVESIKNKINDLVLQSASLIKKQKLYNLSKLAVNQCDGIELPPIFLSNCQNIVSEIEEDSADFLRQLARCEMLLKIGENLAVLAKVEAVASNDDGLALTPITADMSETITRIGEHLMESKNILAA